MAKGFLSARSRHRSVVRLANQSLSLLGSDLSAAIFWSVTLYDAENSSGLASGQPFPSLGSRDKPAQNADGSTDLYLCPKAPEGKVRNRLATVPGKGFFAILRLYGPTEASFDKSWRPSEIELIP